MADWQVHHERTCPDCGAHFVARYRDGGRHIGWLWTGRLVGCSWCDELEHCLWIVVADTGHLEDLRVTLDGSAAPSPQGAALTATQSRRAKRRRARALVALRPRGAQ